MKKITFSLALALMGVFSFAQTKISAEELAKQNWFHSNFAVDNIYGVSSDAAYRYAEQKGLKPSPVIVAVLDSGMDIYHEDLKNVLWINKDEIPGNGIDDDKNGYIDDVYGWNFIGGADGQNLNADNLEITRLVRLGMKKFDTPDDFTNKTNREKFPQEYEEFKKMKIEVEQNLAQAKMAIANYDMQISQTMNMFEEFAQSYGADKKISVEGLNAWQPTSQPANMLKTSLLMAANSEDADEIFGKTPNDMISELKSRLEGDRVLNYYKSQLNHYDVDFDPRHIVGDNYADKTEKYYGNNDVKGPDSLHGTHVAGIIGAENNNDIGMNGVARNVQLMSVRTVPDGDEHDKDVANAIRYAVDNGAKIINMSFGKEYSPDKEIVWEAIKYATDKNVLLVHAAGNDDKNIDTEANYPTNYRDGKAWSNSYLTVGASTRYNDKIKASFSNFGKKHVDIYAPGLEIYATTPENTYQYLQGTSMAAPAVSGVAALVWSFYPRLTAAQLKTILIESGNVHDQLTDISYQGKIVDALKAMKLAETYVKK
ncbi:MAG: S8 family peptidase [Flavobacteriaceae bacterium]|nr:S8 family peptidase [Flavobacteriaceae bacterium]